MLFKITYAQLKTFLLTSLALLAVWLFMGHYARFQVTGDGSGGKVTVNISFLAPMNREKAAQRITVTGGMPGRQVAYSTRWISRNTLQVVIDESAYPRGLQYNINVSKAPALIPPFSVSTRKKVSFSLAPRVVALEPASDVPTAGPLVIVFNTPVDPESFSRHISTTAPGKFSPLAAGPGGESPAWDYSRWVLTPVNRFDNNARYNIAVAPGLAGTGGGIAAEGCTLTFTTAPALKITDIYPQPFSPSVWLSRSITVTASQPLREAVIKVEGVAGTTGIKGHTAVFQPGGLFMPNHKYNVSLDLVAQSGERLHREFGFGTTNLGGQRWLGVKVGNPCAIEVYQGDKLLKSCRGWLSMADEKIPRVTMYETKRGSSAEYIPDHPSPVAYLQLNADIMLHYMRPGEEHNHRLIGLPPSYGCILLDKEDLDWILNNVPEKCMVIVH
jgi:hypothetical protein